MTIKDLPPGMGYLASPYTHKDKEVMAARARLAAKAWLELMAQGLVLYPSITAGVGAGLILGRDLPPDYHFWKRQDLGALRASSYMLILTLPGWGYSYGITDEVSVAVAEMDIPVYYLDHETGEISTERPAIQTKRNSI